MIRMEGAFLMKRKNKNCDLYFEAQWERGENMEKSKTKVDFLERKEVFRCLMVCWL
jgi:hypothetical protein